MNTLRFIGKVGHKGERVKTVVVPLDILFYTRKPLQIVRIIYVTYDFVDLHT